MIATATALVALNPRAVPSVSVSSYTAPGYTKTSIGDVAASKHTTVNRDNCTALPLQTLSFEAIIINPCPKGTSPELTVYNKPACNGQGTVDRSFDGTCVNPVVAGQSAFFKCNSP